MNRASRSLTGSLAAGLCLLLAAAPARAVQPGDPAPPFSVRAGARCISSRDIAGRVAVITAETKSAVEVNRPFKAAVLQRWQQREGKEHPAIIPVVACFGFFGFFKDKCESAVAEASRKEGLVIYTDSTGDLFGSFGCAEGQSTIVIVDRKGIVRLRHAGRLADASLQKAVQLIEVLLRE